MKSFRLFAIASLTLLGTARADLTVVQKVDGEGGLHRITMKVKGDKARVEVSPQVTTIIDAKTGAITNLMNDKKIVMTIPGEKAKAMAEMAKSFVKDEAPAQATPKPTGKKETINGYETEEYVTDSPKFHASYWVATTYPDYAKHPAANGGPAKRRVRLRHQGDAGLPCPPWDAPAHQGKNVQSVRNHEHD